MSDLRSEIDSLKAEATKLDKGTEDVNAIGADFDPTEYLRTKEVRNALSKFIKTVETYRSNLFIEAFGNAPKTFQTKVFQTFELTKRVISQVIQSIQKRQGNQQARRIDDSTFKDFADQIAKQESDLFELLKGLSTSELAATKLEDIAAAVQQRLRQLEALEEKIASSSKAAAVVITANTEKVSLVESISEHHKASKRWLSAFAVSCVVTFIIMISILLTSSGGKAAGDHLKLAVNYIQGQPPIDSGLVSRSHLINAAGG